MLWFFCSFLAFLCVFFKVNEAQCSYSSGGKSLDLTSIKGSQYSIVNSTQGATIFKYIYSPCQDGVTCTYKNGSSVKTMASQENNQQFFCSAYLASYTTKVVPTYEAIYNRWFFNFSNGAPAKPSCPVRYFYVYFYCNASSTTTVAVTAGEPKACTYTFSLSSCLACDGGCPGGSSSSSSSSLSGGWIFIIILIVVTFVYCVAGYIYNGYKNQKQWANFKENTPNYDFWTTVPQWTWAGCCVTKDFIVSLYDKVTNKSGNSSSSTTTE